MNMKQLLATKYCTVGSQLSFKYEAFLEDMRRKEAENKGGIKIYMTQQEVDMDETLDQPDIANPPPQQTLPTVVELKVQSKRNTHVTEALVTKPFIKGGMHVGSFMFDDLMMATY